MQAIPMLIAAAGTAATIAGQRQQERKQRQILNQQLDRESQATDKTAQMVQDEGQKYTMANRQDALAQTEQKAYDQSQADLNGAGGANIATAADNANVSDDFLKTKAARAVDEGNRLTAVAREAAKARAPGMMNLEDSLSMAGLAGNLQNTWGTVKNMGAASGTGCAERAASGLRAAGKDRHRSGWGDGLQRLRPRGEGGIPPNPYANGRMRRVGSTSEGADGRHQLGQGDPGPGQAGDGDLWRWRGRLPEGVRQHWACSPSSPAGASSAGRLAAAQPAGRRSAGAAGRPQARRGAGFVLTTNGIPTDEAGAVGDYLKTGQLGGKYRAPGDGMGPVAPAPDWLDKLGAVARSVGNGARRAHGGRQEHRGRGQGQALAREEARLRPDHRRQADPTRVAQASTRQGRRTLPRVRHGQQPDRQVDDQNGPAQRFGQYRGAETGAATARAGAANASAASSYASAAHSRALTDKTRQEIDQGSRGVLQQTDQGLLLVNPRDGTAQPVLGPNGAPAGKPAALAKALPSSAAKGYLENMQNLERAQKALDLVSGKNVGSATGTRRPPA
jgi:hypothetical protein